MIIKNINLRIKKAATVLCKSGKFETGQGTCALICMDQLGDPRKSGCTHVCEVHEKLARDILHAIEGV